MAPPRRHEHPIRATATGEIVGGLALLAIGVLTIVAGGPIIGGTFLVVGFVFAYLGVYARWQSEAVLLNNEAYELLSRGRIAEAEAMLDAVPMSSGNIRRSVELQRALIALRRGDAAAAEQRATTVLATRLDLLTYSVERSQNTVARALRALARASMGKSSEALEDIQGVRADDAATPEALARATVAEAVLLAKRGDHEGLARCLRGAAPLLDHVAPRERALLRAFRRMLQGSGRSVYREPARPAEPAREEPVLAEWVSKIAPEAASFVPDAELRRNASELDTAARGGAPVTAPARRSSGSAAHATLPWIVLAIVLAAIWMLLPSGGDVFSSMPWALAAVFAAALALVVVRAFFEVLRARRGGAALRRAVRALAGGDRSSCEAQLMALIPRTPDGIAAMAHLQLAHLAERRCAMSDALSYCDAGLARLSRRHVRAMNSDVLVPELIAQRAFVLAAISRDAEADAELATLAREHPTFAFMTRSVLRVRMVQALRRRDIEEALRLARERTPELPLNRRDEMLADIVIALAGDKDAAGEVERIASELAEDPELAAWIDFMAPGARDRLAEHGHVRVRVEPAIAAGVHDTEAEAAAARAQGVLPSAR